MSHWADRVIGLRWWWIVGWPVVALLCWVGAPRFSTLLADDAHGFVPADMPSQQAFALLQSEFPDDAAASRAAIIFKRASGLTDQDHVYIAGIARALHEKSAAEGWRVRASATSPMLRKFFESADKQAAVVAVDMPAEMLTQSSVNRVRQMQAVLKAVPLPDGLIAELTGNAALGELMDANAKRDVDMTTLWTFVAVIVILLWIYRSPVAMLLPMVTLVVALMVAMGIVGRAAARGLPVNGLLEMFVVVLVVGTGVDYCLFLFARFREELAVIDDVVHAARAALRHTGTAILASTGTNAAGLATLIFAHHRDLHTSGPTIAFGLCVGTLVVLTFTPALMSVVGRTMLWPMGARVDRMQDGWLWAWAGRVVTERPGVVTIATVGLLAIPAVVGTQVRPTYDALSDFPQKSSFVRGAHLYAEHFYDSEETTEFTMLIGTAGSFREADSVALANCLHGGTERVAGHFPINFIRHVADPLGSGDREEMELYGALAQRLARDFYIGKSGGIMRVDVGLDVQGRSAQGMQTVDQLTTTFSEDFASCAQSAGIKVDGAAVQLAGEAPLYRDIRALRARDFRVVSIAAGAGIFIILLWLTRSYVTSIILLGATLLTYLATYGATWLIFTQLWGTQSISHQLPFLLFIILMSLGQDYNIYVVTRIAEERRRGDWPTAIRNAVQRTGKVVSSCGIIMAAAFGSMLAGSLLLMKQFGVALALGILLDTFVIRPLLVPALLMLVHTWRQRRGTVESIAVIRT